MGCIDNSISSLAVSINHSFFHKAVILSRLTYLLFLISIKKLKKAAKLDN